MKKVILIFIVHVIFLSTFSYASEKKIKTLLFSASWCGQCQRLKTGMDKELKDDLQVEVTVNGQNYVTRLEVVDVSDRKVWKAKEKIYGKIEGVPNLLVEVDGKVIGSNIRLDVKHTPTVQDIRNALVKTIKASHK